MGTTWTVKTTALPGGVSRATVEAGIGNRLDEVDRQMSTWRADSEISRFNRYRKADWFAVSPATAKVVAEALRIAELSGGAFDPTVMPLVDLWSFGPQQRPRTVPTDGELASARVRVGYRFLEARSSPAALRKLRTDVSVDLSAIAKGFAVDRVAEFLNESGVEDYMVEVGGEVRTRGQRADGGRWVIGVQTPQTPQARGPRALRRLQPGDRSTATSGDYRNYFEQDGQRFSHTIDPRTGRPIVHSLASVTVVADSCMTADALATAIMVLGPQDGLQLAEERHLAVMLLVRTGDGFSERSSPEFARNLLD